MNDENETGRILHGSESCYNIRLSGQLTAAQQNPEIEMTTERLVWSRSKPWSISKVDVTLLSEAKGKMTQTCFLLVINRWFQKRNV